MSINRKLQSLVAASVIALFSVGCDQKETLLDVETPDGEVEVLQDKSTGEIEVEATDE